MGAPTIVSTGTPLSCSQPGLVVDAGAEAAFYDLVREIRKSSPPNVITADEKPCTSE